MLWPKCPVTGKITTSLSDLGHEKTIGTDRPGKGVRSAVKIVKKRVKERIAVNGTPISQLRDVTSLAIWDHTVLPPDIHQSW